MCYTYQNKQKRNTHNPFVNDMFTKLKMCTTADGQYKWLYNLTVITLSLTYFIFFSTHNMKNQKLCLNEKSKKKQESGSSFFINENKYAELKH